MFGRILGLAILVSAPACPLLAQPAADARYHIGDTGIRCVRLPCPSRALYVPDARGMADRHNLIYADMDGNAAPPAIEASAAVIDAVAEAWREYQCIAVDGRLLGDSGGVPVLKVERIVGPCSKQ